MIEDKVVSKKMPYMDAIIDFCEQNNIEPEDITKFISLQIRNKLEQEAKRNRTLKDNDSDEFTMELLI
jgi:hypothetical protein